MLWKRKRKKQLTDKIGALRDGAGESVAFNLRDALGDILQTMGLRAARKGLELAFEVSSDVPDAVLGDPGRLRQEQNPLRILLAEDNDVNREIAIAMLEKRGHAVVAAANGLDVLNTLNTKGKIAFDLILMDVQMPKMDGLEATARIRELEKKSGGHIPVIALTAHAMKGDREACLSAGMDGYVSKPLRADELFEAIGEVIAARREGSIAMDRSGAADEIVFDRTRAMSAVDGDLDLFREVVQLFLENCPVTMAEIHGAIREENAGALDRAAHSLRGLAGNFGARSVFETALRLEMMGKSGDLADGMQAYMVLSREIDRLRQALEEFAGAGQ